MVRSSRSRGLDADAVSIAAQEHPPANQTPRPTRKRKRDPLGSPENERTIETIPVQESRISSKETNKTSAGNNRTTKQSTRSGKTELKSRNSKLSSPQHAGQTKSHKKTIEDAPVRQPDPNPVQELRAKKVKVDRSSQVDKSPPKAKVKRRTKEAKEAEAMPLAARTIGHCLNIGAHVSSAGGVQNAVVNSVHIGANAFALFLKSQRKWSNPPLAPEHQTGFHENCKTHAYDAGSVVVPHGSYLVNLAHTDLARTAQAYDSFLDDLVRCERLGIKLYNFHPGNVENEPKDVPHAIRRAKAISHLAANLNRAHAATSSVVTLLENMAAKGSNTLGSTPDDLAQIISQVTDKSRVGFCLDTCHAFASGLDLRTPEAVDATLTRLDETVGLHYLRALHLNDSKAPFDSGRDLHANIGTGFIGLRGFHALMNDKRLRGLPMLLETPIDVRDEQGEAIMDEKGKAKEDKRIWAEEIKLLESLVGMDAGSEEFGASEQLLARKGSKERERVQGQVERREVKKADRATKELSEATKELPKAAGEASRKKKQMGKFNGKRVVQTASDASDLGED